MKTLPFGSLAREIDAHLQAIEDRLQGGDEDAHDE
jgi:hypothetical protein